MRRNIVAIMGINLCLSLLSIFINTFLVAKVFEVTGYAVLPVALYFLLQIVALFALYYICSYTAKMFNAIWTVRVSTVVLCVFLILVVLLENKVATSYLLFGALWGVVQGIYWAGMNYLLSAVLDERRGHTYWSVSYIFSSIIGIVFPLTFGFAIDFGSWALTSFLVLCVSVLMLVLTWFVHTEQPHGSIKMLSFFNELRAKNVQKRAILLWFVIVLWGGNFFSGVLMTILIVLSYGSNVSLGMFGSAFAVVGIAIITIYKTSRGKFKAGILWFSAIIPILVSCVLYFTISPTSVILYNLALVFMTSVLPVESSNAKSCAPQYLGVLEYKIESHLFYESALFVGRLLGAGLFVLVGVLGHKNLLVGCVTMFLIIYALHGITLWFWKRRFV